MSAIEISAPLKQLENLIVCSYEKIEAWLRAEYDKTPPPFYCSTDLRNSGKKIAPVDTNLFPGGFNNLPPENYPAAADIIRRELHHLCPSAKSILLVPENHTRNLLYLDNVAVLVELLTRAGIETKLGRLDGQHLTLQTAGGVSLEMFPIERADNRPHVDDFFPCAVLLNNDLSAGCPPLLQDLDIPVLPPPALGWASRKKSGHFYHYQRVAESFAEIMDIDPWFLSADFFVCPKVDFMQREGMDCLAAAVEETLADIREKYARHGIDDEPYVIVKTNVGTYGMGVMRVQRAEDVYAFNRKQRTSMAVGKEGLPVRDVLIQEGVHTVDSVQQHAAEPVVYMLCGDVAGGFYRVNTERGRSDNLNARGMSFSPLPFETNCEPPVENSNDATASRLYVYSVLARLACVAAAREMAEAVG